VTWLRGRRAAGQRVAAARRDLAVALALAACRAAVWVLSAACTRTAAPGPSTLQAARFYVPALGAISLLAAWLLVRVAAQAAACRDHHARRSRGAVRAGRLGLP
jgi:hypothetical protein